MSLQNMLRRSLLFIKQKNSSALLICSPAREFHSFRLFIGDHIDKNNLFHLSKLQHGRYFQRTFSSQPSTQTHSSLDISTSSGNLADQALAMKTAQISKENSGPEDEDKKTAENQIRALKFTMYAMGGLFAGMGLYIFFGYGAPMIDQNGKAIKDEFSDLPFLLQYAKRSSAEIKNYVKYIVNPSRDKLLPDVVKPPYHQPPYTLLIELTGVLVHPEWTYKTGWRFKKRPGIDYFLSQVAGYSFEVVIYTYEPGMTAFPIVEALDHQGLIHYKLFRDSTKYEDGVHLKDLDKVNRDLSKVIVVDCSEKPVHKHRSNAIVLPPWKGNDDDRVLFDLAALLQTIGSNEIKDVRGVLEYYADYPDPIAEFRRKQMALAVQEQEAMKKAENKVSPGFNSAGGFLGSLFRKN